MADAMPYRAPMTLAELTEVERETDTRHELVDGVAYAMVGGSANHGAVVNGTVIAFGNRLSRPCQVFSESTRLHIRTDLSDDYVYPDVMVVCDPTDRAKGHRERPVLLAEVLSPSTEATDRGRKFQLYRAIPSLEHYLLIDQNRMQVECFDRRTGWTPRSVAGDAPLDLSALSLSIPVRDFYAQADL